MVEKKLFNWQTAAENFDKKPQVKKKWKVSKGNIRKTDSVYLPRAFECYNKILQVTFLTNIWHNTFYSNIMPSLPDILNKI